MKKHFLLILVSFSFLFSFSVEAKKELPLKYDIVSAGSSNPGTSLVKVSVYIDKVNTATDMVKKAAVHGIIFKGYNDSQWGRKRPLVKGVITKYEYEDFFSSFFQDNGDYLNYADMVDGGLQTVKINQKDYKYKVTGVVVVAEGELKSALEEAGIVKKMTSGF